jgi:hypothetical protein
MCEMRHCFCWRRNWWIWNSFVSSSIPHWRRIKQTPIEGALLCWSFNLLSIFQPRFVSFPFFCIFKLTPMRENYRWSETIASLLGFSTCRSTNRFLQRELCHGEVLYLLLFSSYWRHCCCCSLVKRRCNFNGTWTSSVSTEDCADILFPFDA